MHNLFVVLFLYIYDIIFVIFTLYKLSIEVQNEKTKNLLYV